MKKSDQKSNKNFTIQGEIKALEKSLSPPSDTPGDVNQKDSAFHQLKRPSAYKPFLLLITIFILMQSTGKLTVFIQQIITPKKPKVLKCLNQCFA